MSRKGISTKVFAVLLALLIPLSGFTLAALADPGADDLVSLAALTHLRDGVSEWSDDYAHEGDWSIHLKAPGKATKSDEVNEGRIVLKLASDTTLEDIESIEWWVRTVSGYPPHVDLLLDLDDDGESDDALVAEFAYQPYVGPGYAYVSPRVPYGHYVEGQGATYYNPKYDTWVRTFQNDTTELLTVNVSDDTIFWLSSGLSGPYPGGYFGKLEDFKDGDVEVIGPETDLAPVNETTVVLEIQIEVDNWLGSSEAYVDEVLVNEESIISELRPPTIKVIKPDSKTYGHIDIPVKISAYDIFGVKEVWFNVMDDGGEWYYTSNRTYTEPTWMQYLPVGSYTFYAWAENELGVVGRNSDVSFNVRVTELSVDVNPDTLNLRSNGRWITVRITPPSGRTADQIDINTLMLWVDGEGIPALWGNAQDGVLMAKFDRASLQEIVEEGENVEIRVTGEYTDGTGFEGYDTIRVINPGKGRFWPFETSENENKGRGRGHSKNKFKFNWKNRWQKGNKGKSKNKGP